MGLQGTIRDQWRSIRALAWITVLLAMLFAGRGGSSGSPSPTTSEPISGSSHAPGGSGKLAHSPAAPLARVNDTAVGRAAHNQRLQASAAEATR